jgi:hypothetical protein
MWYKTYLRVYGSKNSRSDQECPLPKKAGVWFSPAKKEREKNQVYLLPTPVKFPVTEDIVLYV